MYYTRLLEKLYTEKIRYLIVGGLAVNLYGIPRITQDIDLIVSMEKPNIGRLIKVLKELSYSPLVPVDPMNLAKPEEVRKWIEEKNMIAFCFHNDEKRYQTVDILIGHKLDFDKAFDEKTIRKVNDFEIYLASVQDIIKLKADTGREQDRSDIEMLRKIREIIGE